MPDAGPAGKRRGFRADFSLLGPLELDVLEAVWEHGHVTVRDVYETLRLRRRIADATCMTVMGNLVRKGFLSVDKSARTYLYWAAAPPEQVGARVLDNVVAHLWRGDRGPALARLLGMPQALSEQQAAELRRQAEERFGSDK